MEKRENLKKERANVMVKPSTETWLRFKGLFTMRGIKRDEAITEALELYIKKYKGAI